MRHTMGIAIAAFAFAAVSASSASAQVLTTTPAESDRLPRGTLRAPANAFEIQVNTGYAQGFGPQIPGAGRAAASSIDRAGMGAGLGLAYRATPQSSVGIVGSYTMQEGARGASLTTATASLDATYHVMPYRRFDPFLSLGTGYRLLWDRQVEGGTIPDSFTHGFQLARAAVGVDVRLGKNVAIAPTIGGDVNMFLWRTATGEGTRMIDSPKVNAYLFAGVAGRFDLGGERLAPPSMMTGRR